MVLWLAATLTSYLSRDYLDSEVRVNKSRAALVTADISAPTFARHVLEALEENWGAHFLQLYPKFAARLDGTVKDEDVLIALELTAGSFYVSQRRRSIMRNRYRRVRTSATIATCLERVMRQVIFAEGNARMLKFPDWVIETRQRVAELFLENLSDRIDTPARRDAEAQLRAMVARVRSSVRKLFDASLVSLTPPLP